MLLRSAVGMTHVLRSRLVMDYTTSCFPLIGWDTIWIPTDHMDLCQTHCKQVPITIGSFQFLPTGLHGLCFGCCLSGPLPLRSLRSTHRGPYPGVFRLHSEIDQIHLSIEAQCVTTLLPLDDCHTCDDLTANNKKNF